MTFELGERYTSIKRNLVSSENEEKVKHSWERLLREMKKELSEIAETGSSYIPEVDWEDLKTSGRLPSDKEALLKARGCMIVRGVVPEQIASEWNSKLIAYKERHAELGGTPFSNPTMIWSHWAKAQTEARSHPNITEMYKILAGTWSVMDKSLPVDLDTSVVYPDRFRIRRPGKGFSLKLHLDSGSIERWEDLGYSDVYREIFEGNWENWEPWLIDRRLSANQDLYKHSASNGSTCSTFRTYQGWLSLTDTKAGEGTIKFLPNLKHVIPYLMLRPYFNENNEFSADDSFFPGATPGSGQFFALDKYFPYLNQLETVVSIPYVKPGDFVVWHADLLHEVEEVHNGTSDSNVLYIAQNPLCEYNLETLLDTKEKFLTGMKPSDFEYEYERFPACESNYEDRSKSEDVLSYEGKEALGIVPFKTNTDGLTASQRSIRHIANSFLGYDQLRTLATPHEGCSENVSWKGKAQVV